MTQQEKFRQMTETDVRVLVSKLSVPTIISMLITTIYNMADTFFVGQINTTATAAVGIIFPLMATVQAFAFFFGQGSGNYISKELGRQKFNNAEKMASTAFFSALALGILILVFGSIFKTPIVYLLGSTDKIAPYAAEYMQYILIGVPFYISSLVLNNQYRFQGNAMYGMLGISVGAVLNIILDPVLIFGCKMGIKGAALATTISQITSFAILYVGTRRTDTISISIKNFTPCLAFYKEITRIGLPSLLRQGLASVTNLTMNYTAKMFCVAAGFDKEAAIAAMSIVGKITFLAYSVVIGFGQGFQPVCGFNYGAKKYDRVKKAFWFSVAVTTCFMIVAGIILYALAPYAVAIFNDDVPYIKNQVIDIGVRTLRITCLAFPLVGFLVLCNMLMQNLGIAFRASILAMTRQGLFNIPLMLLLPQVFGFLGIQMAQALSDVLSMIISIILSWNVLRRLTKNEKPAA